MRLNRQKRERRDVVLVIAGDDWPQELNQAVSREGHNVVRIGRLAAAPQALLAGLAGGVYAILVHGRPLASEDLAPLKRCRIIAPSMAIVVLTLPHDPAPRPDVPAEAATAFLSWPATLEELRVALRSGKSRMRSSA